LTPVKWAVGILLRSSFQNQESCEHVKMSDAGHEASNLIDIERWLCRRQLMAVHCPLKAQLNQIFHQIVVA
jgi:hypothetical protein